jgi:hypothetical protein
MATNMEELIRKATEKATQGAPAPKVEISDTTSLQVNSSSGSK